MQLKLSELKQIVQGVLQEFHTPSGGLRRVRGGEGRRQYKIGKIEEPNRELSAFEANELFPGAVDVWCEIVPELYPLAPIHMDPVSIKRGSMFYKEGDKLTVAFQDAPTVTLATWDPQKEDWIEMDYTQSM